MTKMYIDYAVIKQALEFFTSEAWGTTPYMDVRVYEDAARLRGVLQAALRAAPAQQDEPVEPVEPVAWHYRNNGGASVMHWGPSAKLDADMQVAKEYPNAHKVTPLYTAPPKTEPVAWMYKGEPWFDGTRYHDQYEVTTDERLAKFKDENARPLYFAP